MKSYIISGNFKLGSNWQDFRKEITAETEEDARELLLKLFGSKHGLSRRLINIVEVAESTDHSVVLEAENE